MDADMGTAEDANLDQAEYATTYFTLQQHVGAIHAHIGLMVVGWVFILPLAIMFSLARSRYTLPAQFLFLVANALGVITGFSYNTNTPDLYPNNAHHKLGWVATWVVSAQIFVGLIGRIAGMLSKHVARQSTNDEEQAFIPVSMENMAEHQRRNGSHFSDPYRHSNDGGQGTEPRAESLRSNSLSTAVGQDSQDEDDDDLAFKPSEMLRSTKPTSLLSRIAGSISSRSWRFITIGYDVVDRTILILGYIALCTGVITYARFFEGHEVFSGLAHWIKGGIFFWYGVLTLGRWSGSFGELGWAWNVRPKQSSQRWRPTAEFVEGALIFTYGATNIFLEHLGKPGDEEFSPEDLEHVSITVLFIGGGLLAMLVESTSVRELLNTTVTEAALAHPHHAYSEEERDSLEPPATYEFSINPIPALVILLLGIMMSSHTQESMISSMVHKQWGNLLTGASFARGFTYVLLYLKPPRSILPSRPPTELLTAFGLISGGTVFMASSGDTVAGMEHYGLDAMFFYTVTMGLVGLLMAWIVILLAIKGWAVRKESGNSAKSWSQLSRL
ncbi:hypothetical protein F5Y15DRAFT_414988 [Xylariaceae sp. FL0016]|nr:hypothetical protein F5Y15DRAFT_414988 [Xylariaceae sp. FL0016]